MVYSSRRGWPPPLPALAAVEIAGQAFDGAAVLQAFEFFVEVGDVVGQKVHEATGKGRRPVDPGEHFGLGDEQQTGPGERIAIRRPPRCRRGRSRPGQSPALATRTMLNPWRLLSIISRCRG